MRALRPYWSMLTLGQANPTALPRPWASQQTQKTHRASVQRAALSGGAAGDTDAGAAAAKRARLLRLTPDPAPVDPVLPPTEEGPPRRQQGAAVARGPLSAYELLQPVPAPLGEPAGDGDAAAGSERSDAELLRRNGGLLESGPAGVEETTTGGSIPPPTAAGAFLRSRGRALRRLQQRQRALLSIAAQPPQLRGGQRPVPDAPSAGPADVAAPGDTGGSGTGQQPPGAPGSVSPYRYTVTRDGRIAKAEALTRQQQRQQERRRAAGPVDSPAAALADDLRLLLGSANAADGFAAASHSTPPKPDSRRGRATDRSSGGRGSQLRPSKAAPPSSTTPSGGAPAIGPPPVTLRVFTYCIPHADLKRALWTAGLPPGAVAFATQLKDADLVLHLVPAPGEKQFAYQELRSQARDRGIPFVSVRSLHPDDLIGRLSKAQRLLRREAAAARGAGRGRGRGRGGGRGGGGGGGGRGGGGRGSS